MDMISDSVLYSTVDLAIILVI